MTSLDFIKINLELRKSKDYITNMFFSRQALDTLIAEPSTTVFYKEDLIALFVEETDMIRTYFCAKHISALIQIESVISSLPNKPIITDVIGKEPQVGNQAKALQTVKFEQYSVFIRMYCSSPPEMRNVDFSEVQYAVENDINELLDMLYLEFDPLFAHIPNAAELKTAISKKEITVIRKENCIAGMTFFENTSPHNICLRYFIVSKKFRRQGIGSKLLAKSFTESEHGTRYMLWVGTYNPAIEKYN